MQFDAEKGGETKCGWVVIYRYDCGLIIYSLLVI